MSRASLLNGIAVAAGTGLAIGFCVFGRRRAASRTRQPAGLGPLIERLDRLETHLSQAAWQSAPAVHSSLVNIDERLAIQARELELLRNRLAETERTAETETRLNAGRFKEAASTLPSRIEAVVLPRIEDLRHQLSTEIKESIGSTLEALDQSFGAQVSSRITAFEGKLLEHSTSLADLSHQTSRTNANVEKLVQAVERLCDQRSPEPVSHPSPERAPASQPASFLDMPFDMPDMSRATAPNGTSPWPGVREDESPRRSRVTFGHVIAAVAAAFISARFAR